MMAKPGNFDRFKFTVKQMFSRGWGYPFIGGFLILLLLSAIVLAVGWVYEAEFIADIAYFALVVGVVLELAYFQKSNIIKVMKRGRGVSHKSS